MIEEIKASLDKSESPVSGGKFKKKLATGGKSILKDTGDMRSSLEFGSVEEGIEIGIFNPGEAPKAFNHNVGDTLPQRMFIPNDEGSSSSFKKPIRDKVKAIVEATNAKVKPSKKQTVKDVVDFLDTSTLEFPDG